MDNEHVLGTDPEAQAAVEVDIKSAPPPAPSLDAPIDGTAPTDRDRIVVLGRTQAGKTVFLSCLYYTLWSNPNEISTKALDGPTHRECIEIVQTLRDGNPPAGTTSSRYLHMEVTYHGVARPLVSLDYPGEVFRKAFIDGAGTEDVIELLDHIDRAAGVIALIDPAVVETHALTDAMDDDFAMLKALERIRNWPGGEDVPIALVLTKYDIRRPYVKAAGGPDAFVKKRFPQLVRSFSDMRVFLSSAVQHDHESGKSGNHPRIHAHFQSHGVVEPLKYLLDHIDRNEQQQLAAEHGERTRRHYVQMMQKEKKAKVTRLFLWVGFCIFVAAIVAVIGYAAWWMGNQ